MAVLALALTFTLTSPSAAHANHAPDAPSHLTVDDDTAPLAVTDDPAFGWWVNDPDRNEIQSAYELVVSDPSTTLQSRILFDSGRVASSQQAYVHAPRLHLIPDHEYSWTVRTWDRAGAAGPYAPDAHFDTGLHDGDWHADWIRRPGAERAPLEDFSLFRKVIRPGASPIVRARVYASAGQQYELFIGGVRAAHGPSFSYPDEQYYETTDVTSMVNAGSPAVFAFITHWSTPGQGRPPSVPAFIARIVIDHRDGTRDAVTTDSTWRTHAGPWIQGTYRNDEGDLVEHIDERLEPAGWMNANFDDHTWPLATVIGAHPVSPFRHLVAARTHIVYEPAAPVSVRTLPNGAVVADFGAVTSATPVVAIRNGHAGRAVNVVGGYLLDPNGQVSTTKGIQATDMHWEFVERADAQSLVPFGYLAFRYLEVDGDSNVTKDDISINARHASMPDVHAASFNSSDATLNAVWNLAQHSALYDSQEQFLDTPTREKGPFLGDSFDVSQAAMVAFGERALTFQALRDFANSQRRYWPDGRVNVVYPNGDGKRDIPDATETLPLWVWYAYQQTGDRDLLESMFPVVNNIANYVSRAIDPKTGLVTRLPGGGSDYLYGAVDWPPQMRYGYDMNTAARTTMNVLALEDFRIAHEIGDIVGRGADVHVDPQTLEHNITSRLTTTDGTYVDGLDANGKQSPHHSQQANAYALAAGLVPPSQRAAVASSMIAIGTNMGVVNFRVLLDAMHAAGRDDALVTELTDPTRPGYAEILQEGATFTWESWNARQVGDSESHGWGSTVLAVLQQDILGVQLTGAGAATVDVTVPKSSVTHADGITPTQRGPITVHWTRAGAHTTLDVTIPPNVVATFGGHGSFGSGHYVLHD
ncbi:MAG TPA: family 78 glycoside hydrolase catalytic domain, partial [Acidimicrobiia bacterium]|nr:family 78 glycoside hydrolase catalytic domain [Acidimicrobiia bacterium]